MKTTILLASLSLLPISHLSAQLGGDPTTPPSGTPTNTFRTLDQVEARIPLVEGAPGVSNTLFSGTGFTTINGFFITSPGSYFLTENLDVPSGRALVITANNVTLDLNGFVISSQDETFSDPAIQISGATNVRISNGIISGNPEKVTASLGGNTVEPATGFSEAVKTSERITGAGTLNMQTLTPDHVTITGLDCSLQATAGIDLSLATISNVKNCSVRNSQGLGIVAQNVSSSFVVDCDAVGIEAETVNSCNAESSAASGIVASLVTNSVGKTTSATASHYGIDSDVASNSVAIGGANVTLQNTLAIDP
ncbi:MAG: hypothetical protein AAGC74_09865 [Verrucomicrobiota bacterium]